MAFSCKTGSIDRCLELDVMAPASERPSLVFWFGCQYGSRSFSPRTCLAFIFLSVIFPLSTSASVDVASAHTRLLKSGGWGGGGGGGESGTEEFRPPLHKPDPAGSFFFFVVVITRPHAGAAWKHQNIRVTLERNLRPGLTIELVNERPGRFYHCVLQSAALIFTGMTQGTCDPCSLWYSASHSCGL